MDFKVWSRNAPDDDLRAPKINDCRFEIVDKKEVSYEEIPAEAMLSVDGISYLTHLRLSEFESESAVTYARKFALKLAGSLEGVLEDPSGDKRFTYCTEKLLPPQITEFTPMLTLSVWFEGDRGFKELYPDIVDLLEREFPLALPSKYGDKVPPELIYSNKNEFVEFLTETPEPVWYATRPVTHVHINDAQRAQVSREGLRVNRISLRMPDALYEIEEWKFALRRLLKSLTLVCNGFFGQICRTQSGVSSWWWRGVPLELGVACTFGEPYYSLIPDCEEKAIMIGERVAYFEEPNGPYVPAKLISSPKRRSRGGIAYPDDFTEAQSNPVKMRKIKE